MDIFTEGFHGRGVTLEQLRAFVFIAEQGCFGRAGEILGRTQSTLSASLKRLEEEIGCRLINRRQGHILGLTDEGRMLLPAARDILVRMTRAMQSIKTPLLSGKITFGVPDDFCTSELHKIIVLCLLENPGLRIEVTSAASATLAKLFEQMKLDIVILKEVAGQPIVTGLEAVLCIEPLYWVSGIGTQFHYLREIPLVTFPSGCVIRKCATEALERVGKAYYCSYTSGSFENIKSAAKDGIGIALLPENTLTDDLRVITSEQGAPDVPAIQWVLRATSQRPQYQRFAQYLQRLWPESDKV